MHIVLIVHIVHINILQPILGITALQQNTQNIDLKLYTLSFWY